MGCISSTLLRRKRYCNIWAEMAAKYHLETVLSNSSFVIQVEVIHPAKKKQYKPADLEIRVFDIWDKATGEYLDQDTVTHFCRRYSLPRAETATSDNPLWILSFTK